MNAKITAAALVILAFLVATGCGDGRTPHSASPLVTSLTISGKTSSVGVDQSGNAWLGMVPGETAQLSATAAFSDGTQRDVTAETVWRCPWVARNCSVSVVSPGVIRAGVSGWDTLEARYGSAAPSPTNRAAARVRVAPEGVFLLDIAVVDVLDAFVVLDALVEVTSPAGAFSARSDFEAPVTLPVVGDAVLQVEKAGYVTVRKSMTVGSDQLVEINLRPAGTAQLR